MINRKKILIILMTMALMTVSVGYVYATQETNNNSTLVEKEYKAGEIDLESVLKLHPATQDLYSTYQEELAQLENNNSTEKDSETKTASIKKLNQKYIALLREKIQDELDQFTNDMDLDVLLIDNTIVSGNTDLNPENLSKVTDVTEHLITYLSNSTKESATVTN